MANQKYVCDKYNPIDFDSIFGYMKNKEVPVFVVLKVIGLVFSTIIFVNK